MIQVLIATHGSLAGGFKDAAELIMGENENLHIFALYHTTGIDLFGHSMLQKIESLNTEDGVLIFTDLFGASPYNQATLKMNAIKEINYRIISGVNLPMVLESLTLSKMDINLESIWKQVLEIGKDGIKEFKQEFEKHVVKRGKENGKNNFSKSR